MLISDVGYLPFPKEILKPDYDAYSDGAMLTFNCGEWKLLVATANNSALLIHDDITYNVVLKDEDKQYLENLYYLEDYNV